MPGAGQFTPGPVLHYVVIPQYPTTAYFLGTHVTAPKARAEMYEIPVYNDLGGRSARFQSISDGEEWKIQTTLNRFDLNLIRTLRYLKSGVVFGGIVPNPLAFPLTGLPVPLGTQSGGARGTMVMGVQDFQLILVNSYAGTLAAGLPTTAAVDLNSARGYASCSITAYEEDTETTRVLEISIMIEARGLFNPSVSFATVGTVPGTPPRGFANYWEGISSLTLAPVS